MTLYQNRFAKLHSLQTSIRSAVVDESSTIDVSTLRVPPRCFSPSTSMHTLDRFLRSGSKFSVRHNTLIVPAIQSTMLRYLSYVRGTIYCLLVDSIGILSREAYRSIWHDVKPVRCECIARWKNTVKEKRQPERYAKRDGIFSIRNKLSWYHNLS